MKKTLVRMFGAVLLGGLLFTPSVAAQTATTTTTLSSAVTDESSRTVIVASATGIDAGGELFIDRELLDVVSTNGTAIRVRRGSEGTRAAQHASGSLVYVASRAQKTGVFVADQALGGSCTRANEAFLPQIDVLTSTVWDCPVGALLWAPVNIPGYNTARSESFDLDNGAGTTVDVALIRSVRPIQITTCRIVYTDATAGTVAAGNMRIGITVGGSEVVASTAYTNAATVGSTTAMVIVAGTIAANVPVLVRHTGVAATAAGRAQAECDYVTR